jgi:anti-sigma regulatory factor (Ser/Thr protein kinase)
MTIYKHIGELKYLDQIDEFVKLFNDLFEKDKLDNNKVIIDLSELTFVSPIGAISLLLLFEKIAENYKFNIIPPNNNIQLISYLERINFFKLCSVQVKRDFELSYDIDALSNRTRHDTRKVMLELTRVQCDEDIDTLYDSIIYILKAHNIQSTEVSKIANILSELGTNILDHSLGTGYAAIQYYPSFKKVVIGIGDNGIGIINSFETIEENKPISIDIITHAFTGGKTSKKSSRGWGLTDAREFSFTGSQNTNFYLRTHDSVYQVYKDRIELIKDSVFIPGSYFLIEIVF